MLLFALAIAPAIAIIWYIYHKDKYDREPKKYLIVSFLLGMLSTIPAIIIQLVANAIFGSMNPEDSIVFYAFYAFIIVAISEELSKFMMVRLYAYPKKAFDEPLDGIVYAVMVSMGFATLENVAYVYQHGIGTAFLRMFLSVPAHASFGVLMGYYIGLAKFNKENAFALMRRGVLTSVFFHGAFDFFLFLQNNAIVTHYVSSGLLVLGAVVSYYIAIRMSFHSIRLHQEISRIEYEERQHVP